MYKYISIYIFVVQYNWSVVSICYFVDVCVCSEERKDLAFFLYLQLCRLAIHRECGGTPVISDQCPELRAQSSELLSFYICSSESVVGHQWSVTSAQSSELLVGQQHLQLAQSTFKESCLHFGVTSCILNTLSLEMGIGTQQRRTKWVSMMGLKNSAFSHFFRH